MDSDKKIRLPIASTIIYAFTLARVNVLHIKHKNIKSGGNDHGNEPETHLGTTGTLLDYVKI